MEVTEPSNITRYACDGARASRCINVLHTTHYSTVNITFSPVLPHTKFLLQYSAGIPIYILLLKEDNSDVHCCIDQGIIGFTEIETLAKELK